MHRKMGDFSYVLWRFLVPLCKCRLEPFQYVGVEELHNFVDSFKVGISFFQEEHLDGELGRDLIDRLWLAFNRDCLSVRCGVYLI